DGRAHGRDGGAADRPAGARGLHAPAAGDACALRRPARCGRRDGRSGRPRHGGVPAQVRVAAVDLGTNTTRLLVADVDDGRVAERTLAVATNAVRDAENGEAFLGEIEWGYGFATRLASGDEEAMLTRRGV